MDDRAPIVALLAALVLLPAAARASCQTPYCYFERARSARAVEATHREELARDPRDVAKWQAVLEDLAAKPGRERQLARYVAHVDWEARPELEIDLEARVRQERVAWIEDWKQAFPGRGEPWCAEASVEESPAARVELLRGAAARLADDVAVQRCLSRALYEAGRTGEAETLLQEFLNRHPNDRGIHAEVVGLMRARHAPPEEMRAALEEGYRRFPDDYNARQQLLQFYEANGLAGPRDRVLAEIETNGVDFDTRNAACSALSSGGERSRDVYGRCLTRLLADFPPAELPERERPRLDYVRNNLLMTRIHARDWPAIRGLLASWPAESLGQAWATVADWTKDEGCRALRAAWSEGALRPALASPTAAFQASRLSLAFRRCGDATLMQEVERPFVATASDEDLAWMASDAARAESQRRAQSTPEEPRRWREVAARDGGRPLAERLPALLAWSDAAPADPEPALSLSRAHEEAGQGEEAVRWLVEAASRESRRGTDLLLKAARLALRFRLHDTAATTARKVLAAAATPRQQAEAHYLLGRVALREGRREEAATELLRYFPLRMRYVAGCGSSPDRGLVVLLVANHDLARLRAYLAERDAALAWYREHLYHPRPERASGAAYPAYVLARSRYHEPLSCLAEPLPQPLPTGVTDAGAPSGVDLEPLFDDEQLLSFSEKLTTVG